MIFFSFNFALREYFFCTSPAPPVKFSNGPSLKFLDVNRVNVFVIYLFKAYFFRCFYQV